jgi:hypothetical protein
MIVLGHGHDEDPGNADEKVSPEACRPSVSGPLKADNATDNGAEKETNDDLGIGDHG